MALAIIGGMPERFTPFAELHREAARRAGNERPALSINSHGYIADTSQQALDESFPHAAAMMNAIGRERGWPPMGRADYDAAATLRGANFVGSPQQIVEKILFQHELFGHDRFLVQFAVGSLPHDRMLRSIELLGTEVAPAVRAELARRVAA
jgi:alkanesulfonate monooxygenase SsuD/methylene tetrahydromethanopterin reductase-like flavin-dependent oxidoreductase (luciferase family)